MSGQRGFSYLGPALTSVQECRAGVSECRARALDCPSAGPPECQAGRYSQIWWNFAFCGPVLGPENGRKKRAVFLWHLWPQGVAVGLFQVPTNVTGAAWMDASEPKGHRLNLSETIYKININRH